MKAEISTGAWILPFPDRSENLRVEVEDNGDVLITQYGRTDARIRIEGKNVRECYWLADALLQAGELSKKRPLDI